MRENPYASPESDIESSSAPVSPEPVDIRTPDNPYLARLFRCRTHVLRLFTLFVVFGALSTYFASAVISLVASLNLGMSTETIRGLITLFEWSTMGFAVLFAFWLVAFHALLFLTAQHHGGILYGLTHLAAAVCLTPTFLFGVLFIPLLVRGDIERLEYEDLEIRNSKSETNSKSEMRMS